MEALPDILAADVGQDPFVLGPLLDRIRLPIVLFLIVFATGQHIFMLNAPAEWRLSTMLIAYAGVIPALGWFALRGLARFAHRIERVQRQRLQALTALRRRTEQIEILYSATRLLADGYAVEPLLDTLSKLALRISAATGVGIHWQPDGEQPAVVAVSGIIDPADVKAFQSECTNAAPLHYVPLSIDGHALGWIAINDAKLDPSTRHSLELLAQEIGNLWRARRSEHRTWTAFSTIDRAVDGADDLLNGAVSVLGAMAKATTAVGASFYCRGPEGWRCRMETGRSTKPPVPPDNAVIWRDEAQNTIYVASDADNVLALIFDRLPSKFPNARERQLLQAIGCQAGWLTHTTDAVMRMLERERGRIAAELHNGLSQTLAYLHLQVSHALAMLRIGRVEVASSTLEELTDVALDAYQTVRRAVDDLCLQPAPWETPIAYLKRIAQASATRSGLALTFTADERNIAGLQSRTIRTLAGVLQEAVNNAACHGGAHDIDVTIQTGEGGLDLLISDNGCGFVPGEVPPGHHGLTLMRERIEALGGRVTINGGLGSGTELSLFVPTAQGAAREAIA
jgi:signal transduction histidine kinase